MKCFRSRFGGLYVFGLVFLSLFLLLRIALCIRAGANMDRSVQELTETFLVGFFFDLVTFFYIVMPAALFLILVPDRVFRSRVHRWLAMAVYFVAVYVLLFDVAAEWLFWDEFESRFNFVAVDYLIYTHELIGNIWESYPVAAILGGLAVVAAAICLATGRWFRRAFEGASTLRRRLATGAVFLAAAVASFLFVDQAFTSVCENHYNNEVAKDGLYSFFYALRHNEIDYASFYLTEDDKTAFARLRQLVQPDGAGFVGDDPLSITRRVVHSGAEQRHNVVIVVVESLSARYLGAYGSTDGLTPRLDALARESLCFTRFYATGTRTDRGLEAVTLSLPPTPGRSMVKRPDNDRLFSIGPIFRQRGYETKFVYSGFSTFDNMNAFYEANGFKTVDGADFAADEITFQNAWGVCDQDLYRRAIKECDRSFGAGKPFCCIVLTTSNHRPFTFPPQVPLPPVKGRRRGVAYSDYAIGELVDRARSHPWFDDTVFVFVADHCASSAGRSEVPVDRYHIPCLIYAPKIVEPRRVDTVASQMDLAPTLLGLLNFSYTSKFFGHDILASGPRPPYFTSPPVNHRGLNNVAEGRAFVGNYEKVGLYRDGKLMLLLPKKQAQTYLVAPDGGQTQTGLDEALLADTMSYYQPAAYLLRNHLYEAD